MLEMLRQIVQEVNAAPSMEAALALIVRRVREAMGTEVCTVYLRDPASGRYFFAATEGLNPAMVGSVSLAPGEGLVGLVAEREEPVNLDNADQHPSFRLVPGIGEEPFVSFLGVPIIHQREVLGVLVVQQAQQRRFDNSEEAFLVTTSAQLAAVIAHARVSGSLLDDTGDARAATVRINGIAGASGIAIGTVAVISPVADLYAVPARQAEDRRAELRAFRAALQRVRQDIENVASNLSTELNPEDHALFDVYLRILDDSAIGGEVAARIKAGSWAQGALSEVMIEHIRHFERMEHSYLKERAVDVKDLGTRVLAYLQAADKKQHSFPEHTVLVGEELTASVLGEVPLDRLAGLVSLRGSSNSHVAILARAMGLPAVMGAVDLPLARVDEREVIVDGYQGCVYLNPSPELRERYAAAMLDDQQMSADLARLRDAASETLDGYAQTLWVNTGLMVDIARSLEQGAEGVGLYRTEVPFLIRDRFPTEDEQRQIYREQLQAFAPRPVTMRTLDIGGDKALPYFPIAEENPFLGWRGIRVTLDHPEIFLAQVRAMMKASEGLDNLRIMLPMISNLGELAEAQQLLRRAHAELLEEGLAVVLPAVGVMIEVPAAVFQARSFAAQSDFLSVGSNDLTQYLLAVDRNNSRVADLYHSYHPAVLQALNAVAIAGAEAGCPVSICGELAGDPLAAPLLLAMDFDVLSMNASSLTRIKKVVRSIRRDSAQQLLQLVLRADHASQVQQLLEEFLCDHGLQVFVRAHTV